MSYEPTREVKRIAEWLRAMGRSDLAKDILIGAHWEWIPGAGHQAKSGNATARTGQR